MNIYLVRHGETSWNEQGLWQGSNDIPLNELGLQQAQETSERLCAKMSTKATPKVYSSHLLRAMETANLIASSLGSEVIANYELREIELGNWEGKHEDIITASKEYKVWAIGEECAPGGESKRQAYSRAIMALRDMAKAESHDFIVVTHTMIVRMIVCHILSSPISDWNTFAIDNGAVTTINYDKEGDKFKIITLNEK